MAAVKGRFAKKTAPADAAAPTDAAAPANAAAIPADVAAASVDDGTAAEAPATVTEAAQHKSAAPEQPAAAAATADAEWTEVQSSEAVPSESATAGDPPAAAIEPVHIEAAAEDLEVVAATQQKMHLDDDAAGTACALSFCILKNAHHLTLDRMRAFPAWCTK